MNLLIVGDSFAADWTPLYPSKIGWPNMLAEIYNVTNVAQAGCSEYKILKQLTTVDLEKFDTVLISHTMHDRVHTAQHPIHSNDVLHMHCDLILADIEYHHVNGISNQSVSAAFGYFKYHYDDIFYKDIYNLLLEKINAITSKVQTIHISHNEDIEVDLNFKTVYKTHSGLINHYSDQGNKEVFEKIHHFIKEKYHGKTI